MCIRDRVLAGAPGITPEYYEKYVGQANVKIIFGQTYRILQHADCLLYTSFLVICIGRLFSFLVSITSIVSNSLTNENLAGEALSEFKGRISVTTKFGHEVIDGKGTGRQTLLNAIYCRDNRSRPRIDKNLFSLQLDISFR